MKKLKVAVIGAGGRVGKELEQIILNDASLSLHVGVGRKAGKDFFYIQKEGKIDLKGCDLVIDFSSPDLFREALKSAVQNKVPFISGTTGLASREIGIIDQAAKKIPVLWAANMSLGVATLKAALSSLVGLQDFDVFIEEFHHNKKKDNPSGTALALQDRLRSLGVNTVAEPIGLRGGGIYGIHRVHAVSEEEHLVFEHQALNRAVFAKGALIAGKWLYKKKPGRYSIEDVFDRE